MIPGLVEFTFETLFYEWMRLPQTERLIEKESEDESGFEGGHLGEPRRIRSSSCE